MLENVAESQTSDKRFIGHGQCFGDLGHYFKKLKPLTLYWTEPFVPEGEIQK